MLEIFNDGVAPDTRPDFKKDLDYKHEDLAGSIILDWKEKPTIEWKKYTPREQYMSLSCVGQSGAKAFEILGYGVESAHPLYRNRANYPAGGMWLGDLGNISKKIGTTKEILDVSQGIGETKMNLPCDVEKPDKTLGYVFPNHKDIDKIAEAIELQKHCLLIFYCNKKEWIDVPKYLGLENNFGHCITAVDYTMYNGQKCLVIEDSTGHFNSFDGKGQRIITEDFLVKRCGGAMYLVGQPIKPPLVFTRNLKLGCVGKDVRLYQIRLGIGADGLFGVKTQASTIAFQKTHNLTPDGIAGKLTFSALNML